MPASADKSDLHRHIVILVENLPVPFDRRPWQIAQTLKTAGHDVSIVCPRMYDHMEPFERLQGIDIHRYPNREGNTALGWMREYLNAAFWMLWICLRLLLTRGIDAIHACNPPDLLFAVAWPLRVFCGVRFLFDHHDLAPEVYLAKFGRRDRMYRVLCRLEAMTYRLAHVVLATNESFKRIATQRDPIEPQRIFVVRNAPQAGRLVPAASKPALREGRAHLAVYLGVMNQQDGVDLLLDSIGHIIHTRGRRDTRFVLIGDGPERPGLIQRTQQMGLEPWVNFPGRITDGAVLSDYLNTASLCVCPDPRNAMNDHSTMTKVVEYLAMGKPVVAYDLRETRYSAADAAMYAPDNDPRQFGDLVIRLLDDAALRQQMGQRGKARYDQLLSWERSQEQLLRAYEKLLMEPRIP